MCFLAQKTDNEASRNLDKKKLLRKKYFSIKTFQLFSKANRNMTAHSSFVSKLWKYPRQPDKSSCFLGLGTNEWHGLIYISMCCYKTWSCQYLGLYFTISLQDPLRGRPPSSVPVRLILGLNTKTEYKLKYSPKAGEKASRDRMETDLAIVT